MGNTLDKQVAFLKKEKFEKSLKEIKNLETQWKLMKKDSVKTKYTKEHIVIIEQKHVIIL